VQLLSFGVFNRLIGGLEFLLLQKVGSLPDLSHIVGFDQEFCRWTEDGLQSQVGEAKTL